MPKMTGSRLFAEAPQSGRLALHFATDSVGHLFEEMPLQQALLGSNYKSEQGNDRNQLNLFAF